MSAATAAAPTPTTALTIRDDLDLTTAGTSWTRLCRELGVGYHCYPERLVAWRRCFDDAPLRLFTAHRDGRLVGVLPTTCRRGVLAGATDRFPIPAIEPIAVDAEVVAALFRSAAAARPRELRWRGLALPDGAEVGVRAAIAAELPRLRFEVEDHEPVIDLTRTWEEQLTHVGRSHWRDLRRRRRRAEELGHLTFESWRDTTLPASVFEECLEVEASGWKGRQGTAIACQPAQRRYYRWLTTWFAEQGWLRLDVMRLDGRVLAFELNAAIGTTFYGLKVGHDESMRRFAPGLLLQSEVLTEVFDDPRLTRASMGTGVDPLKRRWATALEPRFRVRATPDDVRGRVRDAGTRTLDQARARLVTSLDDDHVDQLRRVRAGVQRVRGRSRAQVRP